MGGFLIGQIRARTGRLIALCLGILVASVSFVLLTSAVATSKLQTTGTVSRSFRPAYDILVRPAGSFTKIEEDRGLVRANYLSGIFGGISLDDYRTIKKIPGVEVAAPIANIGYVMPFEFNPVLINRFLSDDPAQLYRLSISWDSNHGLATYPDADQYVYYTRRHPLRQLEGRNSLPEEVTPQGRAPVCSSFVRSHPDATSPFDVRGRSGLACFSSLSPEVSYSSTDYGTFGRGKVGAVFPTHFPIQLAAIDPVEEEKLVSLGKTLTSGRMLTADDRVIVRRRSAESRYQIVPILAAERTYVDESSVVRVERLDGGSPDTMLRKLTSDRGAYRYVAHLKGSPVGRLRFPAESVYDRMLDSMKGSVKQLVINYDGFWTIGSTSYESAGPERLAARPRPRQLGLFDYHYYGPGWAPQENRDTHFRKLAFYQGGTSWEGNESYPTPALRVVGEFDPGALPGFSPLSRVPLETYYPPQLEPADAASRAALSNHDLSPNQNLSGYIAQPPLLLTTLKGLRAFTSERNFRPLDPHLAPFDRKAPLASIRVRVAGVTGPDPLSRKRIETVATTIHERTGLLVDVTAGSSPHELTIALPAGRFGSPALNVKEGWVLKGVAVRFLQAIDQKSLALFFLVLLACAMFLANSAFAAVRARRVEIGTLLCLGWTRRSVFSVILGELALVGLFAGVLGTVVSVALVWTLDFHLSIIRAILVVPIALVLALASGLLPAWRAAKGSPLDAVRPPVWTAARVGHVRRVGGVALANLARVPSRTIVGAAGLFVGVGALTVLVAIQRGFQGTLVGTVLGEAISLQVRGVDLLAVALVLALGALSVADVLYLNISERRLELVTLRTLGWRERDVSLLITLEGVGVGLLGAGVGALTGLLLSQRLIHGISVSAGLTGAALALGAGVVATTAASLIPAARIGALTPPTVLAEE